MNVLLTDSPKNASRNLALGVRQIWIVLLSSFWLASVCNIALWRELTRLPGLGTAGALTLGVALALVITLACSALLSLLAWRWTLKPAIIIFLFSAAFGAYFMMTYGVVIDKTMIVNAMQTDARETSDLLSWRMAGMVLVLAGLPSVWLLRQNVRFQRAPRQFLSNIAATLMACALIALVVFVFFQSIATGMRNSTQLRYMMNPLNSFYAIGMLAAKPFQRDESAILPLGEDAKLGANFAAPGKPPLLLLVLGETARSGNFSLNGYDRPTNTLLTKETVASQRNAWSCGTSTAASVPCMFSNLGRTSYDGRPVNYEGLLDVLQHAGLAVLWLDNQSGCKGTCDRLVTPSVDTSSLKLPDLCDANECLDEVMLKDIDARIAALPPERSAKGVVIVMHQMGSHGPAYYKRSPQKFKNFLPECMDNALQSCSKQSLVNAYDNSIVYTDYFLASSIAWLKTRSTSNSSAMIYLSDHGESLGEDNLYLHGMPYGIAPDVQKRVPWITWLSPEFEKRSQVSMTCLNSQLDKRITHDNYFHSVLGLMNVQTSVYQGSLDIYAHCGFSSANIVDAASEK
jgi:lipid A ethanolaminephosphotransferase